ncbi:hypothetical protein B0H13DRAFT_2663571 [Mycena leptocephala]|nr:hypothetical protein B0H13DRAFT_2663571 [Mycena leptocephala]
MLSTLEADRTRRAEIETLILHHERSIAKLRAEKTQVQGRLDSYKYPVLTLPNEIVSEIFLHFMPPHPIFPPLNGLLSPATLTQICRRWREVALAVPALWSTIELSDRRIPFEQHRHITENWLKRSRHCPLSIYLNHRHDDQKILSALLPHRARLGYLKLTLSESQLPMIASGPMPLLRHLDLTLFSSTPFTFPEVPLLRTVVLTIFAAPSVILPWAQLTCLTLNNVTSVEVAPILQKASNLLHCELYLFHHRDQPLPNITLPRLETLAFDQRGDSMIGFLYSLDVPALRCLRIPEQTLGPTPVDSLKSFITKSGCNVQKVCITDDFVVHEDAYRQAFPSIPEFSFDGEYIGDTSDEEDSGDSDSG